MPLSSGRKGSGTSNCSLGLPPAPPVQRSASFNASSTVPLKITILDDQGSRRDSGSSYCVKNSKSLSNCSLISKIVFKGDGTRNIISHLVPSSTAASPAVLPLDGSGAGEDNGSIPTVPTTITMSCCDTGSGVDKYRDYYV